MKSEGLFKRILDIREGEEHSAAQLFILQFLQGASIAILFTAAITLFLEELPVSELPLVYLISSAFLWFTGWLYAKLEHWLKEVHLAYLIIGFNVVGAIVIRYILGVSHTSFSFYTLLIFYNIAYLLYNLNFWGVAAQMYDVRESKRLFALVSAGDIPAKFLGYLAAFLFVKKLGAHDLLYISAGFYLISLFWTHRLSKSHAQENHDTHNPDVVGVMYTLLHHRLIRMMAVISFLSTGAYLVVSFILYGYIKHEFHDEISLASFIASLLASSHILKMIVKVFLARRMQQHMSLQNMLLITPLALILVCVVAFSLSIASEEIMALYIFGIMAVLTDMLRSSIQYPVIMSSMQVLPLSERMVGHTVMKGVMDPLAFFLVGLLLFIAGNGVEVIDFRLLGGLLLVLLLLSVWAAMPVEKEYINRMATAIRTRDFGGKSIRMEDPELVAQTKKILSEGTEEEALFLLRVTDPTTPNFIDLLKTALQHTASHVRQAAIMLYAEIPDLDWKNEVARLLLVENSPNVLTTLLKEQIKEEPASDLSAFLLHTHAEVRDAALAVLLQYPNNEGYAKANKQVEELLASTDNAALERGLQILVLSGVKGYTSVSHFLGAQKDSLLISAIQASGSMADAKSIPALLLLVSDRKYRQSVLEALHQMNEQDLVPSVRLEAEHTKDSKKRGILLHMLGQHTGSTSCDALVQLLKLWPEDAGVILNLLVRHKHASICKGKMRSLIDQQQDHAERLFGLVFVFKNMPGYELLEESVLQEISQIRQQLLQLLLLEYDEQRILKSLQGISSGKKELVANSIELLEHICGANAAARFSALFETMTISDRKRHLQQSGHFHTWEAAAAISEIAERSMPAYSPWVQAVNLYLMKDHSEMKDKSLLEKGMTSTNQMVRETANDILNL